MINWTKWLKEPLFVFAYFLLTCLVNLWVGAFSSELGASSDEGAHYVTISMFQRLFQDWGWLSPKDFIYSYYEQYPKSGLGLWPPLFYVLGGSWALLFSNSIPSIIGFVSFICALEQYFLYRILRLGLDKRIAASIPPLLLGIFEWQKAASMVMIDHAVACFTFALFYFLFLFFRKKSRQSIFIVATILTLGVLVKGNFLFVFVWIPFLILFVERPSFIVQRILLTALVPAVLLGSAWYGLTRHFFKQAAVEPTPTLDYFWRTIKLFAELFPSNISYPVTVLLLFFLILGLFCKGDRVSRILLKYATLCFLTYSLFHALVQSGHDPRHYTTLWGLSLLVVSFGLYELCMLFRHRLEKANLLFIALVIAVLLVFAKNVHPYIKNILGYRAIVREILASGERRVLISSEPFGEGGFISEVVQADYGRKLQILRASKLLAKADWSYKSYQSLYKSDTELLNLLAAQQVELVLFDSSVEDSYSESHHFDLKRILGHSISFKLLRSRGYKNRYKYTQDALRVYQFSIGQALP